MEFSRTLTFFQLTGYTAKIIPYQKKRVKNFAKESKEANDAVWEGRGISEPPWGRARGEALHLTDPSHVVALYGNHRITCSAFQETLLTLRLRNESCMQDEYAIPQKSPCHLSPWNWASPSWDFESLILLSLRSYGGVSEKPFKCSQG